LEDRGLRREQDKQDKQEKPDEPDKSDWGHAEREEERHTDSNLNPSDLAEFKSRLSAQPKMVSLLIFCFINLAEAR
jgi:hypothetical protein